MRVAHAKGSRAGVRAVMERLAEVLEEDVEPADAVHPETWALYEELLGRVPRPPASDPPSNGKAQRARSEEATGEGQRTNLPPGSAGGGQPPH